MDPGCSAQRLHFMKDQNQKNSDLATLPTTQFDVRKHYQTLKENHPFFFHYKQREEQIEIKRTYIQPCAARGAPSPPKPASKGIVAPKAQEKNSRKEVRPKKKQFDFAELEEKIKSIGI